MQIKNNNNSLQNYCFYVFIIIKYYIYIYKTKIVTNDALFKSENFKENIYLINIRNLTKVKY